MKMIAKKGWNTIREIVCSCSITLSLSVLQLWRNLRIFFINSTQLPLEPQKANTPF